MESKAKSMFSSCAKCSKHTCYPMAMKDDALPPVDTAPEFCPMRRLPGILEDAQAEYEKENVREFARLASVQEAQCYEMTENGLRTKTPRFEELVQFCRKCGYRKIGLAFCIGLKEEARMITGLLENKGFDVISVNCKVGRAPKEIIGIKGDEKILGPDMMEPMCNPIAQAKVLNAEEVDLAVLLGLCVGHDTLFFKYCERPCTVLAVKDRVLGHNPLAAVYLSKGPYYSRMQSPMTAGPDGEFQREKPLGLDGDDE